MTNVRQVWIVSLLALWWVGCDRQPQPIAGSPATAASAPHVEWVDPKTIQPGPIQRDALTAVQMDRIKKLQAVFAEVDGQSVDQWVDDFKRDMNPDSELAIWEAMAKAYAGYCAKHTLTLEAKKEVFKVVLMRSMAAEDEALQHLELKVLSKDEAREVMRGY